MATAREVIAEAIEEHETNTDGRYWPMGTADAALGALDAQGLCVVSKADVAEVVSWAWAVQDQISAGDPGYIDTKAVAAIKRLDAALDAGGAQ